MTTTAHMEQFTTKHRRFMIPLLAFSFWTLLVLSNIGISAMSANTEGNAFSWDRAVVSACSVFYLWFALTPLVAWLGRLGARGWRFFWAIHLPCSIVLGAAQSTTSLLILWAVCGSGRSAATSAGGFLRTEFVFAFHMGLFIYWALLLTLRGMESQRRLKEERLRASTLEAQLAQAQLHALRMQLQPHFLFNALNAISALAPGDPSQARLMIARLSDFLRLTLDEGHAPWVPLSRELQFLKCYLGIQQVRFQDRLTTRLDVAEDALNASVPSMILQPLVENALRHGLLAKPGKGVLRISARQDGEDLRVRIDDDGLGLPEIGPLEGIGLGNTRTRLKVMFGDAGTLTLKRMAKGTRAELRFPFIEYAA